MFTSCVDPLLQTPTQPKVTFIGEPVSEVFNSSGGHADFDNGVKVTVPASAVSPGSSARITVQPSLASRSVFVLPEGIVSAGPAYLISSEGLSGEVTVDMEHHVNVTSREDADDLAFLEADSSPTRLGGGLVYQYHEVPKGNTEFTPGANRGRLTLYTRLKKFFKVGRKNKGINSYSHTHNLKVIVVHD